MVSIKWLRIATIDLRSIHDFIEPDSKRFAKFQIQKILKTTNILKTFPKAGKVVEEFEDESIREIVCGPYRIFYRIVSEKTIHILTVHHGARNFPSTTIFELE